MAAVQSTMQALGSKAPSFNLPDTRQAGALVSSDSFTGKPLIVMFICNHCPYVVHVAERMTELANDAVEKGFAVVAISSNDVIHYPQDGPEEMANFAQKAGFNFPYLFDQSQEVAKAYGAACTPDFYVFDKNHALAYRGQMDGARPGSSVPVSGSDLAAAIDAVNAGQQVSEAQTPSIGCNIKWKAGNAPDYF